MSNDTLLNLATVAGGDRLRDYDDGTRKWPVGFVAFGDVSAVPIAAPTIVSSLAPLPVTLGSVTVPVSGTLTASISNFPATQTVSLASAIIVQSGLNVWGVSTSQTGYRLDGGDVVAACDLTSVSGHPISDENPVPVTLSGPQLVTGLGDAGEIQTLPALVRAPSLALYSTPGVSAPLAVDTYGQLYATTRGRRAHYILSSFPGLSTPGRVLWLNAGSRIVRLLAFTCTSYTNASSASPIETVLEYWASPQAGLATITPTFGRPVDPLDPPGTAALAIYLTPPTPGVLISQLRGDFMFPATNTGPGTGIKWDFRNQDSKYPTLFTPNQAFDVLFGTIPANTLFAFTFEWLEE